MSKRVVPDHDDITILGMNEPPTKKKRLQNDNQDIKFRPLSFSIDWFAASDKGKKPHMEDRRITISDLSSKFKHTFTAQNNCRLFGVVDGHGGSAVSSYCQSHLPSIFIDQLKKYVIADQIDGDNEEKTEDLNQANNSMESVTNIQRALHATFKICDDKISKWLGSMRSEGAVTTLAYFQNDMVFTGNIGDAKAVLARVSKETAHETDWDDHDLQPLVITKDHTVLQLSEVNRIIERGGHIINGRVNGILEVTRSFGDPEMKKIGVIAAPNISKFKICQRDKFMIIGCDGLWSVFSVSDAIQFVYEKLNHISKPSVQEITRQLIADAILNKQAKDNVTAIIICFNHT